MKSKVTSLFLVWPGIHTLQETFGCEIQGNDTRTFWRLGYDGQNLLRLDEKTLTWKASVPSAHTIKTIWESHGPTLGEVKAFLYHLCPDRLQRCLTYLRSQMMDKGTDYWWVGPFTASDCMSTEFSLNQTSIT